MRGCFSTGTRGGSPSPGSHLRCDPTSPRKRGEVSQIPLNWESLMQYAPGDLTQRERYKVLTGFVLQRPIAWVTTVGPTGVVNAAPFIFFNVFCEDPPLCMFAANLGPDGLPKDTTVNIERTGEFVVNLADEPLARAMHETSGDFPPDIGERQLIMGEGINFHIRDELWDPATMRVHMDRYHPVGRMFADRYCRTDDRMVFPPAQGAQS